MGSRGEPAHDDPFGVEAVLGGVLRHPATAWRASHTAAGARPSRARRYSTFTVAHPRSIHGIRWRATVSLDPVIQPPPWKKTTTGQGPPGPAGT